MHNYDSVPRTCTVTRPDLPAGSRLEAGGACGLETLEVTVPAAGTSVVRVAGERAAPVLDTGPRPCPIFAEDRP